MTRWFFFTFLLALLHPVGVVAAPEPNNQPATDIVWSTQEQIFLEQHPVIRVANEQDWPPFDFVEFGQPRGFSIDYIHLLAQKVGFHIEFVNGYRWDQLLDLFEQKQIDVMPVLYRNREREAFTLFSEPYYRGKLGVFTRERDASLYGAEYLLGKRVGIQRAHGSIADIREQIPGIHLVEVSEPAKLVTQLATGKLDAIIGNPLLFSHYAREEQALNIRLADYIELPSAAPSSTLMHVGVRKDWPILHQMLQKAASAVSEQEMQQLKSRWTGIATLPLGHVQLNRAERAYIQKHPVIRVSNELDYPPYDFAVGSQAYGYSIDLLDLIAARTGLTLRYVNGYSWAELLDLFLLGELDLLHTLHKSAQREGIGLFSKPFRYYKNHWVVRKNAADVVSIEQLYGKTVVSSKGWSQVAFLSEQHPQINLLLVEGIEGMLDAVTRGEADALMAEVPVVKYQMATRGISDLKISGWVREFDNNQRRSFHFMAQRDAPELISILDKGLESLTPLDIARLERKWFGTADKSELNAEGTVVLTDQERDYLSEKLVLSLCVTPEGMPYGRFDQQGQFEGLGADYFSLFEQRLGRSMALFALEKVGQSEGCDAFLLAEPRALEPVSVDFTAPYLSFPYVIATHRDQLFVEDISKVLTQRFAVVAEGEVRALLAERYPSIELVPVSSPRAGLEAVRSGEVFGFIDTSVVVGYAIQNNLLFDVKIAGQIPLNREFMLATRVDEPLLGSIFQKVVASLSEDEQRSIYNRWIAVEYARGVDYALVWQVLIIAAVVLLAVIYWNRKLALARWQAQFALKQLEMAQEQLQKKNEELSELAITDALTGLFNRIKLDDALAHEMARNARYAEPLAIIMVDIDHFKQINDRWGHPQGDQVLQQVATILRDSARQVDIVGRWGGEEFLIICPETDRGGATTIAEKLRLKLERCRFTKVGTVTGSFGVAELIPGESEAAFMTRADAALYQAKKRGRNRVEISALKHRLNL